MPWKASDFVAVGADYPVEQATAAPGEKRAVGRGSFTISTDVDYETFKSMVAELDSVVALAIEEGGADGYVPRSINLTITCGPADGE